jgi:hypothetical protein
VTLTLPPENAAEIYTLMTWHSALTLAAFLAGPVMLWQAWRDRARWLFWMAAALPLAILVQRLAAGDRCVVQDYARRLWGVTDPDVWAPDLFLITQGMMTYVVDACIVSYAIGLVGAVTLFLHRRHGLGAAFLHLPPPARSGAAEPHSGRVPYFRSNKERVL